VPQLPNIHGVIAAPAQHLLLATATKEKTLALIDDTTFEVKSRVPAGEFPNGLAFDPASGKVFVSNNQSNNRGQSVAVVDVKTARPLPGIDIGGGAGITQWDAESGHVLAAVHDSPSLVDIDPTRSRVAGRIALHDVTTCHGLLVASTLRLAFALCRRGVRFMVVVDLRARRQTMILPLPVGIDDLAFDPGLQRLYGVSDIGFAVVFAVAADRSVTEMGRVSLTVGADSVAVDPATHRVYFALENVAGRPVLRVMDPRVATGPPQ
jgi:DNA-binding beta-propeller fold protein YncE